MSDDPSPSYLAKLQRANLLAQQGRSAEAEKYFQEAIAEQPSIAIAYGNLAYCYAHWPGHDPKALETIDRAISLNPNHSPFFAIRAWALGNLNRHQDALYAAHQSLTLDSTNILALNARTRAYLNLNDWKLAEEHARETLRVYPNNTNAANFLALALSQQAKIRESKTVTAELLAQNPEDSALQTHAGYQALQASDHLRANRHFLEALRLAPNNDYARRGLLRSINARVWVCRRYYQFIAWLWQHRIVMRSLYGFAICMLIWLITFQWRGKITGENLQWSFIGVAFSWVILGFGGSFSNLFLLLDPYARYSLTRTDIAWSIFSGSIYALILGFEISEHAWMQSGVLLIVPALFIAGIFFKSVTSDE